jgi:AcrR family transcriptional regulator
MSRSKARNAHIRAQRRQAILEVAVPLFAAHGFTDTGISDIAQAAGISHGTVFLYFPTKEALFRAAVTEPLRTLERALSIEQIEGTPLERLEQVARGHVSFVVRHRDYLRLVQYVLGHYDRFPELAREVSALTDRYGATLVALIHEGQEAGQLVPGDPDAIALAYLGYLNGIGLVVNVGGSEDAPIWDAMTRLGIRIFGPTDMSVATP